MIRALSLEEKTLSHEARNRANAALKAEWRKIDKHYRAAVKAKAGEGYKRRLLQQLDGLKAVKGSPVVVRLGSGEIVIDYELLRGMLRRLKSRHISTMEVSGGALTIVHSVPFERDCGEVELYQILDYQRMHLTDLPVIELDSD